MPKYDAFLSYSQKADSKLAAELSAEVERFAKPWYQLRDRRIFRDLDLHKAPFDLPAEIRAAIHNSDSFILIASPASASSPWISYEVAEWIQSRPDARERILIVLSDGEIAWNESRRDFDFDHSTALNTALAGVLLSFGSCP